MLERAAPVAVAATLSRLARSLEASLWILLAADLIVETTPLRSLVTWLAMLDASEAREVIWVPAAEVREEYAEPTSEGKPAMMEVTSAPLLASSEVTLASA